MRRVDLNVDIGEGFPNDEALLEFATSANVCLGAHAGNTDLTRDTHALCRRKGIRTGAHPGYADRKTMGRGPRPKSADTDLDFIFQSVLLKSELEFDYVKPHGSLYNLSSRMLPKGWDTAIGAVSRGSSYDPNLSNLQRVNRSASDLALFLSPSVPLMGLRGTTHEVLAGLYHCPFISEGFADRAYLPNGSLVPRTEPGAVLQDPALVKKQVLLLAGEVDSICLHGDTANCLAFAELVFKTLVDAGYEVGF